MTKTTDPVELYTLTLRREVPITGSDGTATGVVKHLTETHKGVTHEQALQMRAASKHVADAMIEKSGLGLPGKIVSSVDLGHPVNMPPAKPRKPREAMTPPRSYSFEKTPQRAPLARETPVAKREAPTPRMRDYADLVNVMVEEERA